jgi:hypothetical protein
MKRLTVAALCVIGGWAIAAMAGYVLLTLGSPNTHDRPVEAAMAAAFAWGPLGAVTGGAAGWWWCGG